MADRPTEKVSKRRRAGIVENSDNNNRAINPRFSIT
jgi:hypothetical protein